MGKNDYFKYVAVIVAYRNMSDLKECIASMQEKIKSIKIIIVNSYFDEETKREAEQISKDYHCDFLNVENKGYGAGNNKGISLALEKYTFDYIIISNPDIVIKQFDNADLKYDVIAPEITTKTGKKQNPMVIVRNPASEKLCYLGFKKNKKILLYIGIGLNRITRNLALRVFKRGKEVYSIYQPHGSFVLISKKVVDAIHPIYDEKMFLFAEENVLSVKLEKEKFQAVYYTGIKVNHKEDGSMKLAGNAISGILKDSNVYFYETYLKKHKG